ncbi:MAG: hypothetical protein B7Z66_12385 [Chromatiales bacterium 21-64-14]|nr:MAG: hypothetical protein B7Z66_12385 [Chromatiales bacterium 21-64-14]HQU16969.1 DUF6231 family protein [Gammaproteobacteria bacterium]
MGDGCREQVLRVTAALGPRSILTVGAQAAQWLQDYADAHPDCRVVGITGTDPAAELAGVPRCDLALVAGALEQLPAQGAGVLLSRLRDLHARSLLVRVPIGARWPGHASHWTRNDLLGYGLQLVAQCPGEDGPVHLYRFDLYDYKSTPDWLNPDQWAHPELWDKYRW